MWVRIPPEVQKCVYGGMVDTLVLEASAVRCVGSSPTRRTIKWWNMVDTQEAS